MSFISEFKYHNVLQAALTYAMMFWLMVQVAGLLLDVFDGNEHFERLIDP
jgi:hypothetical protein